MEVGTLENLIEKFLSGRATNHELNELNNWYDSFDVRKNVYMPGATLNRVLAKGFVDLKSKLGSQL
jgi:hypothetical protein